MSDGPRAPGDSEEAAPRSGLFGFLETALGRAVAAAILILAATLILVIVFSSGEDDPAPGPAAGQEIASNRLGYSLVIPPGWQRRRARGVLRLSAPEGTPVVVVSSPREGRAEGRVRRDLVRELRSVYAPARVVSNGISRLGNLNALSTELTAVQRVRGRRPVPTRFLVLVGASEYRTYVAQVTTRLQPSRQRLTQVRQILESLQFSAPS